MSKAALYAVLRNPLYTGVVKHHGTQYPGEHDRIIDQATWDRVQETFERNKADNDARVRNKYGALLRGLLFCVPCGSAMMHTYTVRGTKRYRYYVCYNAQRNGWNKCQSKSVSAQAIEAAVLDSIRRLGTDLQLAEAVAAEALGMIARRRRELDEEVVAHRRGLLQLSESLARQAADTAVDSGARFERLTALQREIEATERRLAELAAEREHLERDYINADDLRRTLAEFDAIWASMTSKEQEQMIHMFVAKVGSASWKRQVLVREEFRTGPTDGGHYKRTVEVLVEPLAGGL